MNVPYNNGKISIGKYYQPPKYIEQDDDMLLIQSYLINEGSKIYRQKLIDKILVLMGLFICLVILLKN